nr:sugar kinase [Bacillus sp. FJAT-49736]
MGEILVEVMAKSVGQSFEETGELVGPFPSGAPAIFINQASKIGSSAGIISTIGNDAFGQMNYKKLKKDGVDVSYIKTTDLLTTGVAFVTYHDNGDRDFIFHLQNSASSLLTAEDIKEEYFRNCKYFHVMGSSLFNQNIRSAVKKAIAICKQTGTKISFDPNIRKELLKDEEIKDCLFFVFENCDIFLPSGEEFSIFTGESDEKKAIAALFEKGIQYIVIKKGSKGCAAYSKESSFILDPLKVVEVDPTGAGDCFGGTLISCLNQGFSFRKSVMYASTAGALAVTKKGPMEGNTTLAQVKEFLT